MTDKLIEEVLRLDAEMTKGPWTPGPSWVPECPQACVYPPEDAEGPSRLFECNARHDYKQVANAAGIAYYRTAAPKLARALELVSERLNIASGGKFGAHAKTFADELIADITKILQEP